MHFMAAYRTVITLENKSSHLGRLQQLGVFRYRKHITHRSYSNKRSRKLRVRIRCKKNGQIGVALGYDVPRKSLRATRRPT